MIKKKYLSPRVQLTLVQVECTIATASVHSNTLTDPNPYIEDFTEDATGPITGFDDI